MFNVTRAYINVTGNLSHIVAFRVTPDIVRQSGLITLVPPDIITNDSLIFRIKYAYFQFNLDDWMTRGSWARSVLGEHLPLSLPGRLVSLQFPLKLRRRPCRRLRRRRVCEDRIPTLLYENPKDKARSKAMVDFVK